jgi:hypothetical protein
MSLEVVAEHRRDSLEAGFKARIKERAMAGRFACIEEPE